MISLIGSQASFFSGQFFSVLLAGQRIPLNYPLLIAGIVEDSDYRVSPHRRLSLFNLTLYAIAVCGSILEDDKTRN